MNVIRVFRQDVATTSSTIVTISPPPTLREAIGEGNFQSGLDPVLRWIEVPSTPSLRIAP